MNIAIVFQFQGGGEPSAVTEVAGSITDVILPFPGDTVSHRDFEGRPFQGQVVRRRFDYSLSDGEEVDGRITVILSLERLENGAMRHDRDPARLNF